MEVTIIKTQKELDELMTLTIFENLDSGEVIKCNRKYIERYCYNYSPKNYKNYRLNIKCRYSERDTIFYLSEIQYNQILKRKHTTIDYRK